MTMFSVSMFLFTTNRKTLKSQQALSGQLRQDALATHVSIMHRANDFARWWWSVSGRLVCRVSHVEKTFLSGKRQQGNRYWVFVHVSQNIMFSPFGPTSLYTSKWAGFSGANGALESDPCTVQWAICNARISSAFVEAAAAAAVFISDCTLLAANSLDIHIHAGQSREMYIHTELNRFHFDQRTFAGANDSDSIRQPHMQWNQNRLKRVRD